MLDKILGILSVIFGAFAFFQKFRVQELEKENKNLNQENVNLKTENKQLEKEKMIQKNINEMESANKVISENVENKTKKEFDEIKKQIDFVDTKKQQNKTKETNIDNYMLNDVEFNSKPIKTESVWSLMDSEGNKDEEKTFSVTF